MRKLAKLFPFLQRQMVQSSSFPWNGTTTAFS